MIALFKIPQSKDQNYCLLKVVLPNKESLKSNLREWYFAAVVVLSNSFVLYNVSSLHKICPYPELFWSAFFPHFPAFGLNMEIYPISLRIQSEYRKMREKCGSEYLRIWTLFTQYQFYSVLTISYELLKQYTIYTHFCVFGSLFSVILG